MPKCGSWAKTLRLKEEAEKDSGEDPLVNGHIMLRAGGLPWTRAFRAGIVHGEHKEKHARDLLIGRENFRIPGPDR